MRLRQGQIWKTAPDVHGKDKQSLYLRIVELERLWVVYKEMASPFSPEGEHKEASKKKFCRLIKRGEVIEADS